MSTATRLSQSIVRHPIGATINALLVLLVLIVIGDWVSRNPQWPITAGTLIIMAYAAVTALRWPSLSDSVPGYLAVQWAYSVGVALIALAGVLVGGHVWLVWLGAALSAGLLAVVTARS